MSKKARVSDKMVAEKLVRLAKELVGGAKEAAGMFFVYDVIGDSIILQALREVRTGDILKDVNADANDAVKQMAKKLSAVEAGLKGNGSAYRITEKPTDAVLLNVGGRMYVSGGASFSADDVAAAEKVVKRQKFRLQAF